MTDVLGNVETATGTVTAEGTATPNVSVALIRQSTFDGNGDGVADDTTTYTYDSKGNVTGEAVVIDGALNRRYSYTCDALGDRTSFSADDMATAASMLAARVPTTMQVT